MKMNNLSFRTKIYLLIFPLILLVLVMGFYLNYEVFAEWRKAELLRTQAVKEQTISVLIHELQKERGRSVLFFNKALSSEELHKQRESVNKVHEELSKLMFNEETPGQVKDQLKMVRLQIDSGEPSKSFVPSFTSIIEKLIRTQVTLFQNVHFKGEENRFSSLAIFEKAKESMGQLRAKMNQVFGQNVALSSKDLDSISALKTAITANLESPGLNLTDEGDASIKKILSSPEWNGILAKLDMVVEKSAAGNFGVEPKIFFDAITVEIDNVFGVIQSEQKAALNDLEVFVSSVKKQFFLSTAIFLVIMVVSIVFCWRITQTITTNLKEIIENLNDTTPKLTSSAEFLNDLSANLSGCSTQQAAAVQETASSLEEVFGMINKNAENAVSARDTSLLSIDQVKKGQESVNVMVAALEEINKSNAHLNEFIHQNNKDLEEIIRVIVDISNKTKVINDIVFQTKLLSFNASVEAARAGTHGKGFSVVAEEIGNLAVKSGQSAGEINGLLEDSIDKVKKIIETTKFKVERISVEGQEKVKNGVMKAEECSEALKYIHRSVEKVESIIEEVALASGEQSKGVAEINKAMSQIDQVTHQNSQSSNEVSINSGQVLVLSGSIKTSSERLLTILNGEAS